MLGRRNFLHILAPKELHCGICSSKSKVRVRQHVNPLNRIFLEPVQLPDWQQVYEKQLPVHVDIGSARGLYLMDAAAKNMDSLNYLGIEIRKPLVEEAMAMKVERKLGNIHFVRANMNYQINRLLSSIDLPIASVSILHPDPWFKKKHYKRRLVNSSLVSDLCANLNHGTPIYIQTDVEDLLEDIKSYFNSNDNFVLESEIKDHFLGLATDRENYVVKNGGNIFRAQYRCAKSAQ